MRWGFLSLAALALTSVAFLGSAERGATADGPPDAVTPEYLALGDSLAAGFGASDPATKGYVPLFHGYLRQALDPGRAAPPPLEAVPDAFNEKHLRLNNLAHSGDTSTTLISHGHLDAAVQELTTRNGNARPEDDVRVVTVDIGGNDLLALIKPPPSPGPCFGGLSAACIAAIGATFAAFQANFDATLDALRAAAGPDTTIIVMTYYNSLVAAGCPLAFLIPLAEAVLEGGSGLPAGLNDVIRAEAAEADHGARVAETFGLLSPGQINADCVHANDAGYAVIAGAFADTFAQ